jgi:prolyl oligopeptidase
MNTITLSVVGPATALASGRAIAARGAALVVACALAMLPVSAARAADTTAPPTPVKTVTDTYHGVAVPDPYRWMEDMTSPEWQAWVKAQAAHADAVLARIPGRDAMRKRLLELADSGEFIGAVEQAGGRLFYLKSEPGRSNRRLFVREGDAGAERMLIDPDELPVEKGHHAIDFHSPSPDGKLVAVGISAGGSEASVLRVYDVAASRFLPDTIDRAGLNGDIFWRPDNRSFFYNRLPAPGPDGRGESYNKSAVHLHELGRDPARDPAVIGWEVAPSRRFAVPDLPYVHTAAGSSWALAQVLHGDAQEISVYVAPLAEATGPGTPWRRLIGPDDAVTRVALAGDAVYAVSIKGASRGKLLRYDLRRPGATPTVVMPQGRAVLRDVAAAKDAAYVRALDGGLSRVYRVPLAGGAVAGVALPFDGTVRDLMVSSARDGVLLRLEGWTQAPVVYRIDARGKATDTGLQKPIAVDMSGVEAQRVMVKSRDGVDVPLSILSRRGAKRDGSHPTILDAYGAYGISLEPRFGTWRMGWLERDGVFAICHVRGGGEFGADWHNGGRVLAGTKQNTISDFIACAEYLIAEGWTSRARLAGTGGSAGGITIGGAITQRPELFAAAQSAVGVSDLLRMEFTPNGAPNVAEFGTVSNPDHFRVLHAISPYHRVKDGAAYPAVIVTTGANDPRVDAWLPGKFAARLQAATTSGKPVLLRVDFDAGHGMGSTKTQWTAEEGDVWSFFLWQMGEPGFQPAK